VGQKKQCPQFGGLNIFKPTRYYKVIEKYISNKRNKKKKITKGKEMTSNRVLGLEVT